MKKVRRKIAVLLAATMLLSESAMINVFAEDVQMPQQSEMENVAESDETTEEVLEETEKTEEPKEDVQGEENPESQEESEEESLEPQEESDDVLENNAEVLEKPLSEEQKETKAESVEVQAENDEVSEETAIAENEHNASVNEVTEQRLNYIYVESLYLETPGTQNIVVSWGDGTEEITDMTLLLRKENSEQEEWTSVKNVGHLYLFSKEFSEGIVTEYEAIKVRFMQAGVSREYNLSDISDVSVNFGVNKEYSGYSANRERLGEEAVEIETNVVSFDENGQAKSESSVESALEKAAKDLPSVTADKQKTVVVLDPGHDKTHAGASGNGLKEHILTLKIAKYAKAKLEKESNVEVYMTRDKEACAFPNSSVSSCMTKRVEFAASKKASIFVSFHLNAADSSSAKGAEIIHPNKNWKPQVGEEGKELAELIQKELVALGLKDRDIYDKNTQISEYEDGSKQDWYGIPRQCKEKGFPGIIIEHAFITNKDDANKFLKTEAGLKKLGEADATGIINYIKRQNSTNLNGWKIQDGKWSYYEKGKKVVGAKKIDGSWYYFDEEGVMFDSGWRKDGEYTFYYNSNGTLVRGIKKIDGAWYYFKENGDMYTGWRAEGKQKFYYHEDGKLALGTTKIGEDWYYFKGDGNMHTGWRTSGKQRYYYYADGKAASGVVKLEGSWYYFKDDGAAYTGWRTLEEQRFYYHADGKLARGVTKIGDYWYYFKENGDMYTGWRTLGKQKFYYYADGKLARGVAKISGFWYYFKGDGNLYTGWRTLGKQKFYYHPDGKLALGVTKIDGSWYYFKGDGNAYTGWRTVGAQKFYYYADGKLARGVAKISGAWYYFKENGDMYTGWRTLGKQKFYYHPDGKLALGVTKINGAWYYFKNDGNMYTGWRTSGTQKFYYHADGKLALGSTKIGNAWYYFKGDGNMLKNGWANGKYYGPDGKQRDRVYQNPSQYYQIKNSISLSGGGYNLSYGYEGVKVMKVIQKLKLGNGIGMNGAFYGRSVESAVKQFQKKHGLKQTGIVDLTTWLKMGYTKTQWEQWGAYVSPIKVDATSTRSEHIEAMISTAYSYLGTPYVIGASGPPGTGIDCSGLVMQGLYAAGMDISPINPVRHAKPGYEYESRNMWASKKFKHVSYSQRQRGDLIFYQNSSGVVIHVAIYLGNNKVIESWPNKVVVWPVKNGSRSNIKGVVRPFV